MPISQSTLVTTSSLVTDTPPETGQIPASDGNGGFVWVTNNGGEAQTALVNFITDIKRRGFVNNAETAKPYLSGAEMDVVNLDDMGAGWSYYFNGAKRTITGNKTIALTGGAGNAHADGKHYIYINTNDGTLKTKVAPFNFTDEVLVAIVAWNAALPSGERSIIADERHTDKWDSSVHQYIHFALSTQLLSGGEVSGYELKTTDSAKNQFSIAQAVIADEDLPFTLDELVGGNGQYTHFFRTSAGKWGWSKNNDYPFRYTASGRMKYDDATLTGAESPSGRYINTYVLFTNITGQPRYSIVTSQKTYETATEAAGASFSDLDLTNFCIPEYRVVYKFTWETADDHVTIGKTYLEKEPVNYNRDIHDSSPVSLGAPALVEPSVIDNLVAFSTITGDQKDSGKKISDLQLRSEKGQASGYVALDSSSNINLAGGGLKSTNVTTAIKLGDSSNTSFSTDNKTVVGAVNEINSELSYLSAGVFGTEPTFTSSNGSGIVGGCDVLLYPNADFTGVLKKFTVAGKSIVFTDNTEEYVVADYTLGVPEIRKETDLSLINGSNIILLFIVWRLGLVVHSLGMDSAGTGLSNKMQDAVLHFHPYMRDEVEGGLIIAETATPSPRTVTVSGATVYSGVVKQTVNNFTSATDQMTFAKHQTGSWTYADTAVYNNSSYDNGTTLVSLSAGKYGVVWFYRSIGDAKQLFYVLGSQEYDTVALALASQPRGDLPVILKRHCMLVGRSVILSGATNGSIQSTFGIAFAGVEPIKHNDTTNIDGTGTYHISSAEATKVTALGTISSQAANNVAITGGAISGITDLAVADGGTGASDASTARTNLGIGSIATQASNNVSITGGAISGTTLTGSLTGAASLNVLKAGDTMTGKLNTAASVVGSAGINIPSGTAPTSPVNGDLWYDSTQKSLVMQEAGIKQDLIGCIFTKTSTTTVTASVTNAETGLGGTGQGTLVIPAGFLTVGRCIRVRASGIYTTSGNSATMIMRFKMGSSIIATTATLDPNNNLVNQQWFAEGAFVVYSTGSSGTMIGQPTFQRATSATAFTTDPMVNATPVQINTTIDNAFDFTCQFTQTTVGSSLTCTNMYVEVMN